MNQLVFSEKIIDLHGKSKILQICIGDIVDCRDEEIDYLIISAFPGDYMPTARSLIGRLSAEGISVDTLSRSIERDYRDRWHCWISKPIVHRTQPIKQIVCFENPYESNPANLLGHIFRGMRDYLMENNRRKAGLIRMPLLATGDQGYSQLAILKELIRQTYLHLRTVEAIERVQIFLRPGNPELHALLVAAGIEIRECRLEILAAPQSRIYDYFLSYRHENQDMKDQLVSRLRERLPESRIFVDKDDLLPGSNWKISLYQAMARSNHAICLATESYLESPECLDEFHLAINLNYKNSGYLIPLLSLKKRDLSDFSRWAGRIHWKNIGYPPLFSNL